MQGGESAVIISGIDYDYYALPIRDSYHYDGLYMMTLSVIIHNRDNFISGSKQT